MIKLKKLRNTWLKKLNRLPIIGARQLIRLKSARLESSYGAIFFDTPLKFGILYFFLCCCCSSFAWFFCLIRNKTSDFTFDRWAVFFDTTQKNCNWNKTSNFISDSWDYQVKAQSLNIFLVRPYLKAPFNYKIKLT